MHKLHACSLLLGSSDQPDERLYQVFVSCPLFCDRQYLLLKCKSYKQTAAASHNLTACH